MSQSIECKTCGSTRRTSKGVGKTRCYDCQCRRRRCASKASRKALRALADDARKDAKTHWHEIAPPDHYWGKSTVHFKKGKVEQSWDRLEPDRSRQLSEIMAAFESVADRIPARPKINAPRTHIESALLNVVPMGDPHFGMLAWAPETGADYDLDIAQRTHRAAFDDLMARAPQASTCLIIDLGDMHHANDGKSRTPRAGHVLDTDGRWPKAMQATVDFAIWAVERALEAHKRVTWRSNIGNHNPEAAVAFAIALKSAFRHNPRVSVSVPVEPYWRYIHGRCLLGTGHGDTCKPAEFGAMAATDWAEDWGRALVRHAYLGHVHHRMVCKEHPGITVESLRTIAPKDGHAAAHARYRSEQDMRLHTWHAKGEPVSEIVVNVRSLGEA